MSTTQLLSSSKRRKRMKRTINDASQMKFIRIMLAIVITLVLIVAIPIAIVLSPFVIAWDLAGALMEMLGNNKEENKDAFFSSWGDFASNMNKWKDEPGE